MTRQQRRKARRRRRQRRSAAVLLALLLVILVTVSAARFATERESTEPEEQVIAAVKYSPPAEPTAQQTEEEAAAEVEREVSSPEPVSRYADIEIDEDDVYTLACLVYHEARGEPFEGQVAVIEVVLNRCLSEYFPSTVEEVVFQKLGDVWQFSPAPYIWTAEPSETQYEAVHTAIAAAEPILPLDTVYFSTAPYNDSVVEIIGNHYFCSIF